MSSIQGTITGVNAQGNLITSITCQQLADVPRDTSVSITADEHQTQGIFTADHNEPEMTLLALLGESGHLELSIVGDSAKIMLGIPVGTEVRVEW